MLLIMTAVSVAPHASIFSSRVRTSVAVIALTGLHSECRKNVLLKPAFDYCGMASGPDRFGSVHSFRTSRGLTSSKADLASMRTAFSADFFCFSGVFIACQECLSPPDFFLMPEYNGQHVYKLFKSSYIANNSYIYSLYRH